MSITFFISFIILSYPINERPLFYHLSSATDSYTTIILNHVNTFFHNSIKSGKSLGKQLFSNSIPNNSLPQVKEGEEGPLPQRVNSDKELAEFH